MSQSQTIEYSLAINTDMAYSDIRKLEISLVRCLNLAQRFTGDEDLKKGIQLMQKAIMTLRTLQMAYHAVQMARMAAGDPLAWFSAATMVATSAMTVYDTVLPDLGQ
jgi:hypothetical protein